MTDLERFKKLFDELNIAYLQEPTIGEKYENGDPDNDKIIDFDAIELIVDEYALTQVNCVASLNIIFDISGKFKYFEPFGE